MTAALIRKALKHLHEARKLSKQLYAQADLDAAVNEALERAAQYTDTIAATTEDDRYWGLDKRREGEQAAAKNIAMNIRAMKKGTGK